MEIDMKFKVRMDVLAAVVAFAVTRDFELTRLWFAVWHLR